MSDAARDSTAKYRRLASTFTRRIKAGDLRPGDPLPSLRSLYGEWGEATVLRAMRLLKEQGWVRSEMGRGYFVADAQPPPGVEERLDDHERRIQQLRTDVEALKRRLTVVEIEPGEGGVSEETCPGCHHPWNKHRSYGGCMHGWRYDDEGVAVDQGCTCPIHGVVELA